MTRHVISTGSSTASEVRTYQGANTAATVSIAIPDAPPPEGRRGADRDGIEEAIVNAVYAHIQAVRALGRQTVNTVEIASALNIPVKKVDHAINALGTRGVKRKAEKKKWTCPGFVER